MTKDKKINIEESEDEAESQSSDVTNVAPKSALVWQIATVAVIAILAVSIVTRGFTFTNSATGSGTALTKEQASAKSVAYINSLLGGQASAQLLSVNESNGMYSLKMNIGGQEYNSFVTKDGSLLFPTGYNIAEFDAGAAPVTPSGSGTASTSYPKTDKPVVELYVWSYCPYGVSAQGPLAEVAKLLNNTADFKIVPYYDGHGAFETQENKIQLCIQNLAQDKYWAYAAKFVSDIYPICSSSRTVECDRNESIKLMNSLGINSTQIMSCVETNGAALFTAAAQKAQQNSVSGSPTLIINGVVFNGARNQEAYKQAVCSAFNTPPAACGQTLSTTTSQASGNCG